MKCSPYSLSPWVGRLIALLAAGSLQSLVLVGPDPVAHAQSTPPQISALSSSVVQSGGTLTIYGNGFDWSVSAPDINDKVMLGPTALPIQSWSTNQITVIIPRDAASGSLTVQADNGTSSGVPVSVAPRGLLLLSGGGAVTPLDGAATYPGPAPVSGAVAVAATPDGFGYWVLQPNGAISAYGDAKPMHAVVPPATPVAGMAISPTGNQGWLLSQDGQVSVLSTTASSTVSQATYNLPTGTYTAISADPLATGYYAVNRAGTVIGEGTVAGTWHTGIHPAVSVAADPNGGFWVLGRNGSVAAVDGAQNFGNLKRVIALTGQVPVTIQSTPDGAGYYLATAQGKLYAFGDATLPNNLPPTKSFPGPLKDLAVVGPYQPYGLQSLAYWYPPGNMARYLTYQSTMGQALNLISPHWFWVNGNGSVGGPSGHIANLVAEMQAHGLQVVPMFGRAFNTNLGPLATAGGQDQMVQQIMAAVTKYHLNGVNIDFEGLPSGSANYLTVFAQKMRAALGPGRLLVIDVYPDWAPYTNLSGQTVSSYVDSVYNYTDLSQIANYMVVMDYSLSFNPGPVSSLTHVKGIIDYLLHGPSGTDGPVADLNHVLLGIPGYGQLWYGTTGFGTGPSLYYPQVQKLLAAHHVTPQYDPTAGEDFAHLRLAFHAPAATLQYGETGGNVVALQYGLNQVLGHPVKLGGQNAADPPPLPLPLDGMFGPQTQAAVKAFQADFGVNGDASGVYGSATAAALAHLAQQDPGAFAPGVPATVWFEDAAANLGHATLAQSSGLAGVSLWAMGEADPRYFSALTNGTNVATNPNLVVKLSHTTLYSGVQSNETVTVTQGSGFPVANLPVQLLGQTQTTNANGQATFTVTPSATGSPSVIVMDPSGQTVATATVSVAAPAVQRLAGTTRFLTANRLANLMYGRAKTVILAAVGDYSDPLAAAPLAKLLGAPILLTAPSRLTPLTAQEIARLGASNVILLGGPGVISASVSQTLATAGYSVTRYYGHSRFSTAAQIALALNNGSKVAMITGGTNFSDALTAATVASSQGWPVLFANSLNTRSPLTPSTVAALQKLQVQTAYVIGSPSAVPNGVSHQLSALHVQGIRVPTSTTAGQVYGTNVAVLRYFAQRFSTHRVYLATASDVNDALAAPLVGSTAAPLLMVPNRGKLTPQESAWLEAERGRIGQADVLAGPGIIANPVVMAAAKALGITPP